MLTLGQGCDLDPDQTGEALLVMDQQFIPAGRMIRLFGLPDHRAQTGQQTRSHHPLEMQTGHAFARFQESAGLAAEQHDL